MGLQVAVWGLLEGSSLPAASCVGCGPPSSALIPPLTKWERSKWPLPFLLPDAFLMLGKVGGVKNRSVVSPGSGVGCLLLLTNFLFPITYLGLSPFVFSFLFCCLFFKQFVVSFGFSSNFSHRPHCSERSIRAGFCHCLPSMNVFILPALGKWGVARFLSHLTPERPHFFCLFFRFAPKWQLGQCWGIKLASGVEDTLHLLLPGFNSVSVREKTIFSLKQ